jgi:hypothetical protein
MLFMGSDPLLAIYPLAQEILDNLEFTSDFGNPVDTYEDVNPITNIGPTNFSSGPRLTNHDINAFNQPVKDSTGQAFINLINDTSGRVVFNPPYRLFLKHFLYLQGGRYDEYGVWHYGAKMENWPQEYDPGNDPHIQQYFLCLKSGWDHIPPVSYAPDAFSCDVDKDLCDYGPCVREVRESGDEDGNGISNEVITPAYHAYDHKNVYANLGGYLRSLIVPGPKVDKNMSGKVFVMKFEDRTPPRIQGGIGNELPEIGASAPATTGDFYKTQGLIITDNKSNRVGTLLCLGRIDGFPDSEWKLSSDWMALDTPQAIDSGQDSQYVILPNSCHGVMLYSIFAWDDKGLLNPGDSLLVEDQPQNCYGLQSPPSDGGNLGRVPDTAKPWPPSLTINYSPGNLAAIDTADIDPNKRRSEGYIHIKDNDLPNLVIKIRSVKDDQKPLFFPPLTRPSDLTIIASSDYKKYIAPTVPPTNKNAGAYSEFIENVDDNLFTSSLVDKTKPLYFNVLKVEPSPVMDAAEHSLLDRFVNPSSTEEQDFLLKNFCLENFMESDTDGDGAPITGDEDTFGKRNGFGEEVVAVLEEPLQEDVEYFISVWADDNVKWATKDEAGQILDNIISIPSGIEEGEGFIDIPNQYPRAHHKIEFAKPQAVTPEVRTVFREPTKPGSSDMVSYFMANKFPSIEVWVKDFSGLKRKIKLFLRISNENPNIRTIERQHQKF